MKKLTFFIFILAAITGSTCKKENRFDLIKRTGKRITETRILPSFKSIFLKDNIDLYLSQGPIQEIKVDAGENLIPLIKMEVNADNELHIWNENRCNWARSYKKGNISVYITAPSFSTIKHWGSGLIKSLNTITEDTLTIQTHESGDLEMTINTTIVYAANTGSSDITLHGKSKLMGNYHNGAGYNRCEDLQADIIWITSEASGNDYYYPLHELGVTINWEGDVYYKGNPTVNETVSGKGKLIKLN